MLSTSSYSVLLLPNIAHRHVNNILFVLCPHCYFQEDIKQIKKGTTGKQLRLEASTSKTLDNEIGQADVSRHNLWGKYWQFILRGAFRK